MYRVSTYRKRLLAAVAVGAFALSGGSGVLGGGTAFADSSGSATIHFSNASARSNACQAGNYKAIYITVSEVDGHRSGKGGGWTPLVKPQAPLQLNLLDEGQAEPEPPTPGSVSDCMLASMGSNGGLPAGKYQQLRVMVDTNTAPANNACAAQLGPNVFNCVELNDSSFHALTIPSGAQSGIKIPSTKIHQGGLVITPNQGVDIDIDINACRSIVVTGGGHGRHKKPPHGGGAGSYKLKPVLQAGEVSLDSLISGQVVLGTVGTNGAVTAGGTPVPFASLWLEETKTKTESWTVGTPAPTQSSLVTNSIAAETTADGNGNFVFCPVPFASDYELIVNPLTSNTLTNPTDVTITTGITSSAKGGMSNMVVPVVEPSAASTATAMYASQDGSNPPKAFAETFDLGMAQSDGTFNAPFEFANHSAVSPTTTAASVQGCTCPTGYDCSCVTLDLPTDNPVIGPAGGSYTQTGTTEFSLLAEGTTSSGPGSCSVADQMAFGPSTSVTQPTLEFQGCQ